jgi:hypothetical protein
MIFRRSSFDDNVSNIFRRSSFDDNVSNSDSQSSQLGQIEFFEWLLMNFSIWTEATAYFKAARFLELACKFSGIEIAFHGQLGRRTRFQETSLSQLVVKVYQ